MLRRAHILKAAVEGGDVTKAAIETGISPKGAAQQASMILKEPAVRASFAMIMEEAGLSDKFLAEKVKALVDAKQVLYFQKDGIVTDSREVEALEIQRKTLELAAKLKGHLHEQSQLDVNVGIMALVVAAVKAEAESEAGEERDRFQPGIVLVVDTEPEGGQNSGDQKRSSQTGRYEGQRLPGQ